MSEREDSPEQMKPKPMFETCPEEDCGKKYQLTALNAKITTFEKDAQCNYMICTCPECNVPKFYWLDNYWTQQLILNGLSNEASDEAPEKIQKAYLKYHGIELVEPVELTARHEKLIGAFATTLANCPDELLYDFITDENPNKPYPTRWQ